MITQPTASALADAIDSLFYERNKCLKYGQNGYERVKDISWKNVITRLTEGL